MKKFLSILVLSLLFGGSAFGDFHKIPDKFIIECKSTISKKHREIYYVIENGEVIRAGGSTLFRPVEFSSVSLHPDRSGNLLIKGIYEKYAVYVFDIYLDLTKKNPTGYFSQTIYQGVTGHNQLHKYDDAVQYWKKHNPPLLSQFLIWVGEYRALASLFASTDTETDSIQKSMDKKYLYTPFKYVQFRSGKCKLLKELPKELSN
ncbi:hypothetical protein [Candidatus Pelagibacter sp. HIMB1611]|uniref:hypothetical protein n=1 Tax=Candidatus Pelagibacter sp. HIMB1611 TaxID=3413357 RepID=UPI003F86A858